MRFQAMSDLHLELRQDERALGFIDGLPVRADTLVLAGDIVGWRDPAAAKLRLDEFCAKWKKVFYVPGNHEFYGTSVEEALDAMTKYDGATENFDILFAGYTARHEGHRFLGDTLWFPHDEANDIYKNHVWDFDQIRGLEPWVYEENADTVRLLTGQIVAGDIVVTHHLPSTRSVANEYKSDPTNCFFVGQAEQALAKGPAVWVHGHTHSAMDYVTEHGTRVVCNPRGYLYENNQFNPNLVIEVP